MERPQAGAAWWAAHLMWQVVHKQQGLLSGRTLAVAGGAVSAADEIPEGGDPQVSSMAALSQRG